MESFNFGRDPLSGATLLGLYYPREELWEAALLLTLWELSSQAKAIGNTLST
jgi:hypothetical protein